MFTFARLLTLSFLVIICLSKSASGDPILSVDCGNQVLPGSSQFFNTNLPSIAVSCTTATGSFTGFVTQIVTANSATILWRGTAIGSGLIVASTTYDFFGPGTIFAQVSGTLETPSGLTSGGEFNAMLTEANHSESPAFAAVTFAVGQMTPADHFNRDAHEGITAPGRLVSTFSWNAGSGAILMSGTDVSSVDAVPEPATMLLLGTGLAGVAIKTRKRLKSRKSG